MNKITHIQIGLRSNGSRSSQDLRRVLLVAADALLTRWHRRGLRRLRRGRTGDRWRRRAVRGRLSRGRGCRIQRVLGCRMCHGPLVAQGVQGRHGNGRIQFGSHTRTTKELGALKAWCPILLLQYQIFFPLKQKFKEINVYSICKGFSFCQ